MPELPEVETIARSLRSQLVGRVVSAVQVHWPGAIARPAPEVFSACLVGRQIVGVARRAKFLVLQLDPQGYLLVHLRMTGRLLMAGAAEQALLPDDYTRVSILFESGDALHFRDVRKFGRLYLVENPQEIVGDLGPEPLEMPLDEFAALLRSRQRQIKPLLLDQRILAGLGNIYVDESLWTAGIHPARRAAALDEAEVARLYHAIRSILAEAIANKGTTLRDYRAPGGEMGENQWSLAVYGRAGQACKRCAEVIERIIVGSRGTHVCVRCQQLGPNAPVGQSGGITSD